MVLSELIERERENNKIAITHGNRCCSYSELYFKSKINSQFIQDKFSYITTVGIFLPNSIDYVVAYFSIAMAKKIIVPIGVKSKKDELFSVLKYCEIDLIFTNSYYYENLKEMLSEYEYAVSVYLIDDNTFNKSVDKKNFINKTKNDLSDVVLMLHTSGTTSNPKRVMLTNENLLTNIKSNIESLKLTKEDITLIAMPMHFGYCNTAQMLTHLYLGASIVIMEGVFWPKKFFEVVDKMKVTNFTGVPSMLLMLLEFKYYYNYELNSLKYICFGGGNMPIDKLEQLISKFSTIGFVQTYGQTEASPRITALLPEFSIRKIGSVGKPIPGVQVKIANPVNGIGEIIVKGKNVMKGYYKQPLLTRSVIVDGWLYTGDLGCLDREGFLYITGRKKNIIISGGINIYPEEIEECLMNHENVKECCVLSEKHSLLGEVPIAKIVLNKKNNTIEDELYEYCKNKLSDYKIPRKFVFVDSLQKTYNGKIKRC